MPSHDGAVVLLTGLPSSGKSTLARQARERLLVAGRPVEVLDGDEVRRKFWPELTLSSADRSANLARIAVLAALLARNGVLVLVAAIAPYSDDRKAMRVLLEDGGFRFHEVHVATPLEVCIDRDVKGLYARHRRGEISQLTGVDAVYEAPAAPELTIDTSRMSVEDSVSVLLKGVSEDAVEPAVDR
jgi:adenylylsulfate kinase